MLKRELLNGQTWIVGAMTMILKATDPCRCFSFPRAFQEL